MEPESPDERVFRDHLGNGAFQSGVDRGRWQPVSIDWPFALIAVSAAERQAAPGEFVFRFELSNYPAVAPTARPWDAESGAALAHCDWPGGGGRIALAFNPEWKSGTCLYLPCDREAIEGHDHWQTQHPEMIWSPDADITQYLRIIHDLLHSKDYKGIRSS